MAREYSGGEVKTYSVGFSGEIDQNKFNGDFYLARKTGEFYGTDHHEFLISGKDALDSFEKVIEHMDEPVSNPTQIPTFLLAKEAKRDVAVVLGGDGGDEIFGGYVRYYYSKLLDRYQKLPLFLREKFLSPLIERVYKKRNLSGRLNVPASLERYLLFMSEHGDVLKSILSPDLFTLSESKEFLKYYLPGNRFEDFSKYLMYIDLRVWLPDESLLRSDKMTMAHGLEERVPLLDHRLVEFAFKIPTKWKVRGKKNNKWIFREAMKRYLPEHILDAGEKRGWFSPASMWIRGDMKDLAREALSASFCEGTRDYFDFDSIQVMLEDHISRRKYNMHTLWSLLTFQVWYRKFIS